MPVYLSATVRTASKSSGGKPDDASYHKSLDSISLLLKQRTTNANPPASRDGSTQATKKEFSRPAFPRPPVFTLGRKVPDRAEAKNADLHSPLAKHQTEEGIYDYFYYFHFLAELLICHLICN